MTCLFCDNGCKYCEAQPTPDWFTVGKTTPQSHINNVRAGGHPLGSPLKAPNVNSETCGSCTYIVKKKMGNTYYKCVVHNLTSGPATDVKLKWAACVKWEKKQ